MLHNSFIPLRTGATHSVAPLYVCYTPYVKEKEFINKVHKHLPKEIYRWKINDAYHGGVPDAFYSGPQGHCFIEYKYINTLPKKDESKIEINLSSQQKIWLTQQKKNNIFTYAVIGTPELVYVLEDFTIKHITLKELKSTGVPFKNFIEALTKHCLGETNG